MKYADKKLAGPSPAVLAVLVTALSVAACGGQETCEEPEFYEYAEAGRRIEAPEDLDALMASRELVIPEASPRPARDRSAGCLDRPPTLNLGGGEDEDEE